LASGSRGHRWIADELLVTTIEGIMSRPFTLIIYEVLIYVGIAIDAYSSYVLFQRDARMLSADAVQFVGAVTATSYLLFFVVAVGAAHRKSNLVRFSVLVAIIIASFKPRNLNVATSLLQLNDTLAYPYIAASVIEALAILFLFAGASNSWFRKPSAY
jgi:hypothetical protein